jgi:hypothetical protein
MMQYAGIQGCGWLRCKWSGFRLYPPKMFDEIAPGWHYADGAIVLGFFVYQWRVWLKPISAPAPEGGE